jgi:hypothetical protein
LGFQPADIATRSLAERCKLEVFVGKLTIKQILDTLEWQLRLGKTYLSISTGLRNAEPIVFEAAPTFFGVMSDGGFVMAQMCLARLYDKHPGTVTIALLLEEANRHPEVFQRADAARVSKAVAESKVKVSNLASVLAAITHRRDTWFAHIDPRAVNDPTTHQAKAELTVDQLQYAFNETESIIQEIERLFDGSVGPINFLGGDDYKNVFTVLRRAATDEMREFDEAFKAQFGHPPPKVNPE